MTVIQPATEAEAMAAVEAARAGRRKLRIEGGGTRAGLGRPVAAQDVLSTARLSGITLYEPAELVIAARAGTPVRVVTEALDAAGQRLPFEPMDHRSLYGTGGEPTVGGLVATNAAGPGRVALGAVRDHLIGVRFINGRGEAIVSGGRVMKNVTGLDLAKLQCGAHGTLGLLIEVTFKLLPRPEAETTLVYEGFDDAAAIALLCRALGSPFDVSAAAHRPGREGRPARSFVRLDGFADSLRYRAGRLDVLLDPDRRPAQVEGDESRRIWADLRDARDLAAGTDQAVWRLSVAPTEGPGVVARLGPAALDHIYDWGGGLVWVVTEAAGDAGAAKVRAALAPAGGHATLVRAEEAVRARTSVFEPLSPALAALTARVKASLDPDDVFNPGRMG